MLDIMRITILQPFSIIKKKLNSQSHWVDDKEGTKFTIESNLICVTYTALKCSVNKFLSSLNFTANIMYYQAPPIYIYCSLNISTAASFHCSENHPIIMWGDCKVNVA